MTIIEAVRRYGSLVLLSLGSCLSAASVFAQETFYAIDNEQPFLSVVDPATGNEISFVQITVPGVLEVDGANYRSGNGLAINPLTGDMYAAIKFADQAGPGRNLVLLDPATGVGTDLGNMGQPIAGMAFSSAGVTMTHAIAQALGGVLHVPHGEGVAIGTPVNLRYNAAKCTDVYARLAHFCAIGGGSAEAQAAAFVERIVELLRSR